MNLTELGFDFSNLTNCTIKKKNYIIPLITSIIGLSFLPILIVFLILFILKVDIEINGVLTAYGAPEYMQFFNIFLPVFGILTLLLLIFTLYGLFSKPKKYIMIDKDPSNFETFYYIYNNKRNEYIYLTDKFALIYNERLKSLREETNSKAIASLKSHFIFWDDFSSLENYKIKEKRKSKVLKFKTDYGYSKSYYFSNDIYIVPNKITEIVGSSNYGRNNIQGITTYFFEDMNRKQQLEIHPEIYKRLSSYI